MNRIRTWALVLALGSGGPGMAVWAAPATPSYVEVEDAIAAIRSAWEAPQGEDLRLSQGWEAFVGSVETALRNYVTAQDRAARDEALDRLVQLSAALEVSSWPPAAELKRMLDEWIQPRLDLAAVGERLETSIRGLPPTSSPAVLANRQGWISLVDDRLGAALRAYESAVTVSDRVAALEDLRAELDRLGTMNRNTPWPPALALHAAMARLIDRPNLDATADYNSVSPFLNQPVVEPDIVYRSGQVSYVTPGPKTGFGLLSSDQGIAFINSQMAYAITPVRGFQEQVAQDDRGRQAAKLYYFNATTYNYSEATVYTLIHPGGIYLQPSNRNNISAQITASEQPGHGPHVGRTAAALIGLDKERIVQEVHDGAIGQIRQQVSAGTAAEANEKAAKKQAELNAQAARFLRGNNTIAVGPVGLTGTIMRSRPTFVSVAGTLQYLGGASQAGANFPQPQRFEMPSPGISADVHLPSALTNLARGYLNSPAVQDVRNVMVEIRPTSDPAAAPAGAVQITQNADFATFVDAVRRTGGDEDPKSMAVRVLRPERAPQFSADRDGNLVAVLQNLVLEVPAPPAAARGGLAGPPALIYRIEIPEAVIAVAFHVTVPPSGGPPEVTGEIASFETGPDTRVFAVTADNEEGQRLNALTAALIVGVIRNRVLSLPIETDLSKLNLKGFAIQSVSDLHPTGWIRAVLSPTQ